MKPKFIKQPNGTRVKEIELPGNIRIKLIVPECNWSIACSRAIAYWIKQTSAGIIRPFRFGTVEYTTPPSPVSHEEIIIVESNGIGISGETTRTYLCDKCKKQFQTTGGLSKHRKRCFLIDDIVSESVKKIPENIRETIPIVNVKDSQNVTVNIQNNITLREFGKENPRWLTSSFLYNVIQDIPRAIPRLLEQKHFNDAFPENKNLRIDTRRTIDKRLQVFETGRWKIKDSKQTFYRVLLEIYDILCDALENDLEDTLPAPDDDRPPEEQLHISNEIKKLKTNERFIQKLGRIRPVWEDFREKINDHDQRNVLWEDLKTLLLDRHLAIEQGFE